ncbi:MULTISPECIES: response regulator [Ramlibacter]|uniref:Response regulator n=1 Tax=Ramlibacter pinisoli TaxID=2682844 RepID=A0A6N8J039_9BURK|nr:MULTISPECIES: response regulator [Ramlibacter]MBA2962525.1 response regulator [Ramlibacter sp. CGMCC 1.13660]MVQ32467.1 response regulator [Ramlibacter pinisoli]
MSFPLFHRPGTVVFLDDDPDYLEMLALVLPRQWHVRLFARPTDCIAKLREEPPFWEADAWNQQQLVDHWRAGRPLVPQILDYWARSTERYALSRACVVDFSMPGMDGLQVLSELQDWSGARVLLTGQADEQVAVDAFNRGLIEQFIAKQMPEMSRHLVQVVQRLMTTPHPRHAQTWRATLRPEHHALLRDAAVAQELGALASRRWVEHVVIGEPFGVLGLDAAGFASWLQLETPAALPALAEMAESARLPADAVEDIRAGRKLANLELASGLQRAPELGDAFPIGGPQLLGALFPIDGTGGGDAGYTRWLARQPRRQVDH